MSCNCGDSRCCVPQKGERGLRGIQGPEGPQGIQGLPGNDGSDSVQYDSGWKNLPIYTLVNGYGIAPIVIGASIPQFRIVDRVVTINGIYKLPLSSTPDGLNLNANEDSYPNSWYADLYRGSDGGYTKIPAGRIESHTQILPPTLHPEIFTYANKQTGGHLYRTVALTTDYTEKRYTLKALSPYSYLTTDGKFGFGTAEERQGLGDPALGIPSHLLEECSIFSSGDFIPDHFTYGSGFTVATDNRETIASATAIEFDVNMSDGYDFGGCSVYFNFQYHLPLTTSIVDIQAAFDAI